MDQSSLSQNRRSKRSSVLLAATLEAGRDALDVRLRNLSAEGALVEGENLPMEGSDVVFRRKDLVERGTVVWVSGKHAGIAFKHPLRTEQVLEHVPQPRPRMQPQFKRPPLACRELTREEMKLIKSWVWAPVEVPRRG
jgi:hypothetical protein